MTERVAIPIDDILERNYRNILNVLFCRCKVGRVKWKHDPVAEQLGALRQVVENPSGRWDGIGEIFQREPNHA